VPAFIVDATALGQVLSQLGKTLLDGLRQHAAENNIKLEGLPDDPNADIPHEQIIIVIRRALALYFPLLAHLESSTDKTVKGAPRMTEAIPPLGRNGVPLPSRPGASHHAPSPVSVLGIRRYSHNRCAGTISCMDEPPELQHNGHWRMAVWALRVGYLALAVAVAGLIVILSGSTPWVLAVGVISWLAVAAVTLTGFFWARHELPEPRPGYWSMRFMVIHDTIHPLSSA
jgi:hypothetical protein